ncbi:hypothetical protein HDU83_004045 [Entophlyctis luteolus]|nr:hypothetical protein HDU83_004045 [Entophlyctis luteolus]
MSVTATANPTSFGPTPTSSYNGTYNSDDYFANYSSVYFPAPDSLLPGHVIQAGFTGFTKEWQMNDTWVTPQGTAFDPIIQLVRNVAASGHITFRVGGNSANYAYCQGQPTIGMGVVDKYIINSTTISGLVTLGENVPGLQFLLALSMATVNGSVDVVTGGAVENAIYCLQEYILPGFNSNDQMIGGLIMGNEPEYFVLDGLRDNSTFVKWDYISEYQAMVNGLTSSLGPLASNIFVGPETEALFPRKNGVPKGIWSTFANTPGILNVTRYVTIHYYPYGSDPNGCVTDNLPEMFLTNIDMDTQFVNLSTSCQDACYSVKYVLSESAPFTCNSSNHYAIGMWGVDFLASAAWSGFSGVNLHEFTQSAPSFPIGWEASVIASLHDNTFIVNPIYYAPFVFNRMLDFVAQLNNSVNITVSRGVGLTRNRTVDALENGIKYWAFATDIATKANPGRGAVILMNKNLTQPWTIEFTPPPNVLTGNSAFVFAEVMYQTNNDANATSGWFVAGQTFESTPDGKPHGNYVSLTVGSGISTVDNVTYSIILDPVTIVVVFFGGSVTDMADRVISGSGPLPSPPKVINFAVVGTLVFVGAVVMVTVGILIYHRHVGKTKATVTLADPVFVASN